MFTKLCELQQSVSTFYFSNSRQQKDRADRNNVTDMQNTKNNSRISKSSNKLQKHQQRGIISLSYKFVWISESVWRPPGDCLSDLQSNFAKETLLNFTKVTWVFHNLHKRLPNVIRGGLQFKQFERTMQVCTLQENLYLNLMKIYTLRIGTLRESSSSRSQNEVSQIEMWG